MQMRETERSEACINKTVVEMEAEQRPPHAMLLDHRIQHSSLNDGEGIGASLRIVI